jgi:hypothetical protein
VQRNKIDHLMAETGHKRPSLRAAGASRCPLYLQQRPNSEMSRKANSDINSCVRSTPRDEISVGLIAQQGLIKQLGYEIIEEEE